MAKRIKVEEFIELIKEEAPSTEMTREEVKDFAADMGVNVPTAFWKECKVRRGVFGVKNETKEKKKHAPASVVTPSIIPKGDVNADHVDVNEDDFEVEIAEPDGGLVKIIKVIHKESGKTSLTSVSANAPEESIQRIVNFFMRTHSH